MMERVDVLVVGAGPGGMSAALWCRGLGLDVCLIERAPVAGGQMRAIAERMDNVPGQPSAYGGTLSDRIFQQVVDAGVRCRFGVETSSIDLHGLRWTLGTEDAVEARAIVLATGTRRRTLGLADESAWLGRGLAYNIGSRASELTGRDVVIVGGGDDAFEHARQSMSVARTVTIVHRGTSFAAREALQAPVRACGNVSFRVAHTLDALVGGTHVERARISSNGRVEEIPAQQVFVCIGPVPNTDTLQGIALDRAGYIIVDALQCTSCKDVYAVGDVCSPVAPTIASAFGHGATAAKCIVARRSALRAPAPSHREPGSDSLTVSGLTVPARIGVYPSERHREQTLTFDVSFDIDARSVAPSDALEGTVDYAAVARLIVDLVGARRFNLIETVADEVATQLLARFASPAVSVRVRKTDVPSDGASASVEVRRTRAKE